MTIKKILFFSYTQRHLAKLMPLLKFLQNEITIEAKLIVMTEVEKALANTHGVKSFSLDEFTTEPRRRDFDLGWALEPMLKAIDALKPDLLVAIEVNYILRNIIRYCRQKSIKTLVIQHGTPNKFSIQSFVPFEADKFAAWGEFSREFLLENGMKADKIILTGGANFDRSLSLVPDRVKIARELKLDSKKKWIVFTTQGPGAGNIPTIEEIETAIMETAKTALNYPEYELVFQVHPEQTIEKVKAICDNVTGNKTIVTKYKDTEELIVASVGVITFFSTTALDAVILGKPLLLVNLSDDKNFLPFVKMGAAFGAYNKTEISSAFKSLIYDFSKIKDNLPKAAEFVNYKNDGKALERVFLLIREMLND